MAWKRVLAYSSSANLGPGFDTLAVALDAFYDVVEVKAISEEGVYISDVSGPYAEDSGGARSAYIAAKSLFDRLRASSLLGGVGLEVRVWKGIPVGRGLGSSGATAAGVVLAAARAFNLDLDKGRLIEFAGEGEQASAGSPHYDNVSASLLGGLTVVCRGRERLVAASIPLRAWFALVIPMNPVPEGKTGLMRRVLPKSVDLGTAVRNWGRLAAMVHAAEKGDLALFGELMSLDEIIEPARSRFIPCYDEVRKAALERGALGFAISGAGPGMIALAENRAHAEELATAMRDACKCCENPLAVYASVAPGASEV